MPLSEEELRLLEQMERALVEEDPKLASTLRGTTLRRRVRQQLIVAAVGFVVGVGLLMAGAVLRYTVVGILGFVVMLASAYVGLSAWRGQSLVPFGHPEGRPEGEAAPGLTVLPGGKKSRRNKGSKSQSSGSMMERFEERWRRRRDERDGF